MTLCEAFIFGIFTGLFLLFDILLIAILIIGNKEYKELKEKGQDHE